MNEQIRLEAAIVLDGDLKMTGRFHNVGCDTCDLSHRGGVSLGLPQYQEHPRKTQIGHQELEHRVEELVQVQCSGDGRTRFMQRGQLADLTFDGGEVSGDGEAPFLQ